MRDDLIDAEEVEESKALSKALQYDIGFNGKGVAVDVEKWEKDYFERWPLLAKLKDRQKDEADLAEKWEAEFYEAHPELRGLIDVGILVLNGRNNIGYPGGDLIFSVLGTLICRGSCIKLWGVLGDHIATCPIFGLISAGATPISTQGPPFNAKPCSGPCCNPNVPMPGIQATAETAKPMDKKAAGWKGHEYYGYDSDYD